MDGIPFEWIWVVVFVASISVELMGSALISIWFAFGAAFALLAKIIGLDEPLQILIFLLTSALLLAFTRPIAKKLISKNGKTPKTNIDLLIGKKGVVLKRISEHDYGQVKVEGQVWTATIENEIDVFDVGTEVSIVGVSGVKLIVKN